MRKPERSPDRNAENISHPLISTWLPRITVTDVEARSASWRLGVSGRSPAHSWLLLFLCAVVCRELQSGAGCERRRGRRGRADAVGCADRAVLNGLVLRAAGNRHLPAAVLLIRLWNAKHRSDWDSPNKTTQTSTDTTRDSMQPKRMIFINHDTLFFGVTWHFSAFFNSDPFQLRLNAASLTLCLVLIPVFAS